MPNSLPIFILILYWKFDSTSAKLATTFCDTALNYSTTCLKLDIVRSLVRWGPRTRLFIGPGISLVASERTSSVSELIEGGLENLHNGRDNDLDKETFDNFLINSVGDYLGSFNITIQLNDSHIMSTIWGVGNEVWTGRGRKGRGGWWAVGTVAAVGFAMLAAFAGKALMASMFALMMSAMTAMRGSAAPSGGGGKVAQFEIIHAKPISAAISTGPAHYYADHEHHHATYSSPYKRALTEKII